MTADSDRDIHQTLSIQAFQPKRMVANCLNESHLERMACAWKSAYGLGRGDVAGGGNEFLFLGFHAVGPATPLAQIKSQPLGPISYGLIHVVPCIVG